MVKQVQKRQPSCLSHHRANLAASHYYFNYRLSGDYYHDPKPPLPLLHTLRIAVHFAQDPLQISYASTWETE